MKHAQLAAALAVIMMMTVLAAPAVSAEKSVDLTATVLEPKPQIAIELSTNALNFGDLYPGNTSSPQELKVTNIGLKTVDITVSASDDNAGSLFQNGLLVGGAAVGEYTSTLASDAVDETDLALSVPDDYAGRGAVSGGAIFWAQEHVWSKSYSTAMANTNPGAPDPGIPGFVGPDGDGRIPTMILDHTIPTSNYVNPIFTAWATKVIDYYRSDKGDAPLAAAFRALGPVTGDNFDIASLGDLDQDMIDAGKAPGSLTLGFNVTIVNGPGADFACFENGFISGSGPNVFAELGYVEVSTDGVNFVRFPSVSLTAGQAGGYGALDATKLYNLVGKHVNAYGDSWGTPFDLSDLAQMPEVLDGRVDINNINFVRIVDIPGNGHWTDSLGNPIYDAWPTWGTGGLDFEALGVINSQSKQIIADFSAAPLNGGAPLTVQFTDGSVNATSWAWDFDNDGIVDSTERNPLWTYMIVGNYAVKLTVTGSGGSDIVVKQGYITVNEPSVTDFISTASNGNVTITGYNGPGGDVVIPGEIDGLPVTTIGNSAFGGKALTSVVIPNSVTSIGTSAFSNCKALASVTIGSGVTSIGNNAFNGCAALTSVTIPNSVTSMGGMAFRKCVNLASVTIGSGVTDIGTQTFSGCTALTSVTIPDSVQSIGTNAFFGCTALASVTIGSGVTTIGGSAFNGCTKLTDINVDATNTAYQSIDGVVYSKDGKILVLCPAGKAGSVVIPVGVTDIGTNAFQGCTALSSLIFEGNAPTTVGSNWAQGSTNMVAYYNEGANGFTTPTWQGVPCQQL
jgi:PKD repeat protein